MLSNLVYVSDRTEKCTDSEIEKILEACKRNNSALEITGVLLYSDKKFVQYLEGDFAKINALYEKIRKDDRHKNTFITAMGKIEKRVFPSWQMGSKQLSGSFEFDTELTEEDKATFNDILNGKEAASEKAVSVIQRFF